MDRKHPRGRVLIVSAVVAALALLAGLAGGARAAPPAGDAGRGKPIYEEQCAKCHGVDGDGKGRAGRSLEHMPTSFTNKSKLPSDDDLFKAIRGGGKAVGKSGDMEAYPKFSDQEVADLVAYVRTLSK